MAAVADGPELPSAFIQVPSNLPGQGLLPLDSRKIPAGLGVTPALWEAEAGTSL